MWAKCFILLMCFALMATSARSDGATSVAVLPFEIVRGNDPSSAEHHAIEDKRAVMIAEQLRQHISKLYPVVDVTALAPDVAKVHLQACGNCGDDFALKAGARYVIIGEMNKFSELILSLHLTLRDAKRGETLVETRVDLRGNTDESWRRVIDYTWENVFSSRMKAALGAATQP